MTTEDRAEPRVAVTARDVAGMPTKAVLSIPAPATGRLTVIFEVIKDEAPDLDPGGSGHKVTAAAQAAEAMVSIHAVHWDTLRTRAHLAGWVEARQLGLTAVQCDLIVDAAFDGVRHVLEQWADEVHRAEPQAGQ